MPISASTRHGDWQQPKQQTTHPKVKASDPALSALLEDQGNWQIQKRWLEATPNPIYTVASPLFGEFVTNPTDDPTPMLTKIQDAADKYWAGQ